MKRRFTGDSASPNIFVYGLSEDCLRNGADRKKRANIDDDAHSFSDLRTSGSARRILGFLAFIGPIVQKTPRTESASPYFANDLADDVDASLVMATPMTETTWKLGTAELRDIRLGAVVMTCCDQHSRLVSNKNVHNSLKGL